MSEADHWGHDAPSAPLASQGYWQGEFKGPEYASYGGEDAGESAGEGAGWTRADRGSGSLSAAARRSYAVEAIRSKDHVSAGLLAVFLGAFGVHKFYLGCNNAGFIMLAVSVIGGILTLGLAAAVVWVIAIVEGIIYLTKSQTDFDRLYVQQQRDWF